MAIAFNSSNDLSGLFTLLKYTFENGTPSNRYRELLNVIISIDYDHGGFNDFVNFKSKYFAVLGDLAKSNWARAERVYETFDDRMTKPSYLKRLKKYKEGYNGSEIEIDQIENIIADLAYKPKHSTLTFSIFRPVDLIQKKRPGYVPCPVAGDFKFRNKKLELNVFFRSHDVLNFGYPDIYFLRKLQIEVFDEARKETESKELKEGSIGSLNLHFSRVYVPISMEPKKKVYLRWPHIRAMTEDLLCELNKYKEKS